MTAAADEKMCKYCGRPFANRKKWGENWDQVQFCSDSCRGLVRKALDQQIEEQILSKAKTLGPLKSFCPSDIARGLWADEAQWRGQMERVRCAARRLAHRGEILIQQKERTIAPGNFKGPIRLKAPR